MNNIQEQLELLEMMKRGFGKVRTEEEVQDDLDKEFHERVKREEKQREQERLYKERLAREEEERREAQYQKHKDIFDFMKVFNELDEEDYYCVVELKDGKQFMAKPQELKRDENYTMFYIMKQKRGQLSWGENPMYCELEVNVCEVKGIKLVPEEQREITIIKKSVYGKMTN